jgi:hypothetical protein
VILSLSGSGEIIMTIVKKALAKISVFSELLGFLWKKKLWWMIPIIIVLVIFGALIVLSSSSSVAPFIYTLF